MGTRVPVALVGDGVAVPCITGETRPYLNLDAAASTAALPAVAARVNNFLPWYSSVHRGAGYKSRLATAAYEAARAAALAFAGRADRPATTSPSSAATRPRPSTTWPTGCASRPTTSWSPPWSSTTPTCCPGRRACRRRFVECGRDGTFTRRRRRRRSSTQRPAPRLLAVTGASNVTGWLPPHRRRSSTPPTSAASRSLVDAAQLAAHRPLPAAADYLAWSGHKMYAPFGGGVLIGPRATFADGRPVPGRRRRRRPGRPRRGGLDRPARAGGGRLPQRHRRGRPARRHRRARPPSAGPPSSPTTTTSPRRLRHGLAAHRRRAPARPRPPRADTLPIATFVVEGVPHALVAARLSAEYGIGVRHGCFCAHPYLIRLLGLSAD